MIDQSINKYLATKELQHYDAQGNPTPVTLDNVQTIITDMSYAVSVIKMEFKGSNQRYLGELFIKDVISYARAKYIGGSLQYNAVINILIEKMFNYNINDLGQIFIYLLSKGDFLN